MGFGYAVFGDVPSRATLIGAAIIVCAGLYIFLRERALGRHALCQAILGLGQRFGRERTVSGRREIGRQAAPMLGFRLAASCRGLGFLTLPVVLEMPSNPRYSGLSC